MMELELNVGENKFSAKGDYQVDQIVPAIVAWGRLVGLDPKQDDIDKITQRLKTNNDGLAAVVSAHPPTPQTP